MNQGKPYTAKEKRFIRRVAQHLQSRTQMETVVAPKVAQKLGRTVCAICKQLELAMGIHYRQNF